jgi:hypothetical protein
MAAHRATEGGAAGWPRLFSGEESVARCNTLGWSINGHPAFVETWTAEEWARLEITPPDAQECGNGVRVALRIA